MISAGVDHRARLLAAVTESLYGFGLADIEAISEAVADTVETELAIRTSEAMEEVATFLDAPRTLWWDHQQGPTVMQKEGDYNSVVTLDEWLRTRATLIRRGGEHGGQTA